jgi:transposase
MIRSVGIDFHQGKHRVYCLDDSAQPCDSFSFQTTPNSLAMFEEHIFRDGANPVIVFEPAGLAWLVVAVYLRTRHPNARLVKAKMQKVAALRRYLRGPAKSDRIDALTLAKMPFIDPEKLDDISLPPAGIYALQRLTRQRKRLQGEISGHMIRIGATLDGYLPAVRQAFTDPWSPQARAFLASSLNPFAVVRDGEKALHTFLTRARSRGKSRREESHLVFLACQSVVTLYGLAQPNETINEEFFIEFQKEIALELRLMEMEETESKILDHRIEELYRKFHPSDNLRTIPGVGEHTAPVFLAAVSDPLRFHSQSAFANWEGVVPGAKQSSNMEAKGLRMTKAGPSIMRMALYQAGDIGRRYDPQLASVYYREMVNHGKNHKQAMGAVMSHLGARVLIVLKDDRPYEIRDIDGKVMSQDEARRLILSKYKVSEEIRRERRRRNSSRSVKPHIKYEGMMVDRTNEAASAPQPAIRQHHPRTIV